MYFGRNFIRYELYPTKKEGFETLGSKISQTQSLLKLKSIGY